MQKSLQKKAPRYAFGMTIFGYARVSTDGQSVDALVKRLRAAGAEKVFRETASEAKTDRRELARAIKALGDGDALLVTRLDRLARSTRDLSNTLDAIGKAGARFRSLGDAWADTTTAHGRLLPTFLGGIAEFQRELIHARTSEGRERAKARGAHMGRPLSWMAAERHLRTLTFPHIADIRSRALLAFYWSRCIGN